MINMSFNVRPWFRWRHSFWPSKPFGLDIAGLGQQTTKILIATVSPLFYLILIIRLLTIYLKIRQNRSAWLPTNKTLRGLG